MKTAFLLGSIGSGLILLCNLYSFVQLVIIDGAEYLHQTYYIQTIIGFIAWALILICFTIAILKSGNVQVVIWNISLIVGKFVISHGNINVIIGDSFCT